MYYAYHMWAFSCCWSYVFTTICQCLTIYIPIFHWLFFIVFFRYFLFRYFTLCSFVFPLRCIYAQLDIRFYHFIFSWWAVFFLVYISLPVYFIKSNFFRFCSLVWKNATLLCLLVHWIVQWNNRLFQIHLKIQRNSFYSL